MLPNTLQILVILSLSTVHATNPNLSTTVLLNDGNRMPVISLGTVGIVAEADTVVKPAVIEAIEAGYRQIDTAAAYGNEKYVGEAINDVINRGIVTREEIWVTTKLHPTVVTREGVRQGLQESLNNLNLSYVDLYLVHHPANLFGREGFNPLKIWKGMEDVKNLNMTRSIGVSNFNSTHINRILTNSKTKPAANEIEVNPTYASLELVAYCQSLNITVLSYAPFGFMVPRPFSLFPVETSFQEPIFVELAEKYGKIPSQVAVRYLIDRGTIPIPKSTNTTHINTNIDVFDFQLTQQEVYSINELNRNAKVYIFEGESLTTFIDYYGLLL